MEFDKSLVSSRIRGKRAEKRFTQRELAQLVGVSADAINKYESDIGYLPRAEVIIALSNALDCTPNYLLGWD